MRAARQPVQLLSPARNVPTQRHGTASLETAAAIQRHGRQPTPTKAATRENSAPVQRAHSAVASHAQLRQPGAQEAKAAPRPTQRPAAARRTPATLLGERPRDLRQSVSAQSASEFSTRSQGPPAARVARGLENSPRATGDLQPWSSSPSPSWQPAAARREGYLAKRAALAAGEWLTAPAAPPIVWAPARPRSPVETGRRLSASWPGEEAGPYRASSSEGAEAVGHLTQENDDLYREVERLELRVLELSRRGDGQPPPSGCSSPGACARSDTPAGPASAGPAAAGPAAAAPASAVDALGLLQAELRQVRGEQQALTAKCEELSSEREAMEASLRAARGGTSDTADTASERVRELEPRLRELELELDSERSAWRQKAEEWEEEASRLRKGGGGGGDCEGGSGQAEARRAQAEAEEMRREMHRGREEVQRGKEEVQELRRQLQAAGGTGAKGAVDTAAAAAAAAQAKRAEEEVRRAQAEADELRREMQRGKEETQRSKEEVEELRRQLQAAGGTKGAVETAAAAAAAAAAGRAEEDARRAQAEAGELRREAERSKDRVRELEGELADSKQREEDSSKLAEEWKAYADSLENQDEEGEEEGEEESGEESEEEPAKGQR